MSDNHSLDWIVPDEATPYDELPLLDSAPGTAASSSQEDFGIIHRPSLQPSVGAERLFHPHEDWERIKPILHRLYIGDSLSLRGAMRRLKRDHHFEAT